VIRALRYHLLAGAKRGRRKRRLENITWKLDYTKKWHFHPLLYYSLLSQRQRDSLA
jgi:hypothetical protein